MNSYPIIAIIDDNETDQFIAAKIIKSLNSNSHISQFLSAKMALEFLQQHTSVESSLPDVIFLDINMPDLDGWGFLDEYKKLAGAMAKQGIKIYIATSSSINSDLLKASANNLVTGFVIKPITVDKIQSLIPCNIQNGTPLSGFQNHIVQNPCSAMEVVNKAKA